ncbi:MAG TPA: ABC transporter ATP-binding protein [Kiritimatiellia bacterium]|nr:ABC transporter ATP-binding protein [Kiritimatiellia bacterium]
MIALERVTKTYETGGGLTVLKEASLTIRDNDYLGIVGPSGSGKSTLLHILGLLDRPTSGRYLLNGRDVSGLEDDERSRLRGRMIGFIFQSFHLISNVSVVENVETPLFYQRVPHRERRERAEAALDQVRMAHRLKHRPTQLSGGERQRVAIARALVTGPELLLADEPTGNLDQKTGKEILGLFERLHESGKTVVIITHDMAIAEAMPRRVRIVDGVLGEVMS